MTIYGVSIIEQPTMAEKVIWKATLPYPSVILQRLGLFFLLSFHTVGIEQLH